MRRRRISRHVGWSLGKLGARDGFEHYPTRSAREKGTGNLFITTITKRKEVLRGDLYQPSKVVQSCVKDLPELIAPPASIYERFHAKSNVFFYDTSTIKVPKLTIKKTKDNIKGEKQEVPEMGKHTKFVYDENDDVEVDVPQGPASTSTAAGGWAPLPLSLNINQRKNKIRPKPIVAPVKGVICTR
ncbi:hypothetical protein TrLO_g12557 [Triparma laevis f. longispina]|uniref:Uncharacterized protein n=1 Tax=Triparma laevis f. longispina TaxID=1714387 RepID=A0A9W6ZWI8_9STRA|nr:hypothetical protein TrLO_g12557 [Triparma laevis f. longispina]